MWFSISRNSMRALEEIERTRRIRDFEGQRQARFHAREVSNLFLLGLSQSNKPGFVSLEEEERQSRVLDRQRQQIAVKNARKVSGLIAKHFLFNSGSRSYALAMEESERSRRIQDREQERLARANARKVSSLVSSLKTAPVHHVRTNVAEDETKHLLSHQAALPTYTSSQAAPTTIPIAAPVAAAKPLPALPLAKAGLVEPVAARSAPISSIPSTPMGGIAPVNPFAAAPLSTSPLVSSAPVAPATILGTSPSVAPIVLPATTTAVPVVPLASPTATQLQNIPVVRSSSYTNFSAVPISSVATPIVPVDPYLNQSAQFLGERERKRLAKEADRHNKRSEKDVRKAEKSLQKAERLHQKGRGDKASKLENQANLLMQRADHERKWATGIQGEILNPKAPAPAPATM